MAGVKFRYGGAKGRLQRLVEANEYLVVRTANRGSLSRTPLGLECKRLLCDWRPLARFEEAGVEILRSWRKRGLARERDGARAALKREAGVHFAGRVLARPGSREPVLYTENLFVKFGDETAQRACRKLLRERKLEVKRELEYARNAYFVGGPNGCGRKIFDLAADLLALPEVELCHPELAQIARERRAFPQQWHLQRARIGGLPVNEHANVVSAWSLSEGDPIVIAVIDDGVDVDHAEFAGVNKIVAPRDVTRHRDGARPQFASDNHGTACAGVACANGDHGASGVAPRARLMPIRLRSGLGTQNEADAFVWAAQHGADVISCSWGPKDGNWLDPDDPLHGRVAPLPDSTRLAIDFAVENGRNGRGCVITWASGNGNESVDNDGYASYEKVVAVGASDDLGGRAPYSDFGDALWCVFPSDHNLPSVTPGIWTTDRRGGSGYNPGRRQLGDAEGEYTNGFGGTSSACPGAAGVAALVLARNPELRWDEVKDLLRRCCDRIGGGYDASGHSPEFGHGRLNARRAVELARPPHRRHTVVHRAVRDVAIRDRRTSRLRLTVGDTEPLHDLRVEVDIEHTWRGDLIVRLLPPPALALPPVMLHDGTGGGARNLKRSWGRAGAPGLADLVGRVPAGAWTLEVRDRAPRDQGRIRSFTLELDF